MSACCHLITSTTSPSTSEIRTITSSHHTSLSSFPISLNSRKLILLRRSTDHSQPWIIVTNHVTRGRGAFSLQQNNKEEEERNSKNHIHSDPDRRVEILVAAATTVVLGVGNRVLYKLALIPLKEYPFFLAQLATFGYLLVYFSILYFRYLAGIVTDEMLLLPKGPYLAVGFLEAIAAASGMAAGANLSGATIPILSQTFLVWQLLLSVIFLGRRYKVNQIAGCFLVAIGVIITVTSGSGAGVSLKDVGIFWILLMVSSFFFQAADTVLKEVIFLNAAKKLKGGTLDLFVVNSFGSAFQALFICLLLPFLSKLWGVPFSQLPSYLKDGAACFINIGALSKGCQGAPLLPLLFIVVNMAFNVSLLHLVKISSAVVSCLASTLSVPLSVFAFTLPLPYIGVPSTLPAGFVTGVAVLVSGMLVYLWRPAVHLTNTKPLDGESMG